MSTEASTTRLEHQRFDNIFQRHQTTFNLTRQHGSNHLNPVSLDRPWSPILRLCSPCRQQPRGRCDRHSHRLILRRGAQPSTNASCRQGLFPKSSQPSQPSQPVQPGQLLHLHRNWHLNCHHHHHFLGNRLYHPYRLLHLGR